MRECVGEFESKIQNPKRKVNKSEMYYFPKRNIMNLKMPRNQRGVSMKLKKKAKMMIVLSIIANLLSGCGFGRRR